MAISMAVLPSEGNMTAGLQQVGASGCSQGSAETRIAAEKGHAAAQIPRISGIKPKASSAFRADLAITRQVSGEKRGPMAQSFEADGIRPSPGCGFTVPPSQRYHHMRALPGRRSFVPIDEGNLIINTHLRRLFAEGIACPYNRLQDKPAKRQLAYSKSKGLKHEHGCWGKFLVSGGGQLRNEEHCSLGSKVEIKRLRG